METKMLEGVVLKEQLQERGCTFSFYFIGWEVWRSDTEKYVLEKQGEKYKVITSYDAEGFFK